MPRFYFDWTAAKKAYAKTPPQTAWTPAVSLIIQLDVALQQLLEEGVENVFERHVLLGRAAREGIKGMGLTLFGPDEDLNSAVTAAWVPEGIDGKQFVKMLFREHGIQVAGGQGSMEGRIFRIGHCGYFDAYDIIATIAAAELALESLDYPIELGKGVGAAQRVFSKSGVAA
jgi:aspartate aminotransferase-like enzyme